MHIDSLERWQHGHEFRIDAGTSGEQRTWWVICLTVVMMTVEIAAGWATGSMALLADGWHMGTHAAALGITVFAYAYARRRADSPSFAFGTGKVGALGGFASAVALAVVAVIVFAESVARIASPVAIRFDQAIAVAAVGLVVNAVSALILHDAGHDGDFAHRDHHHQHRDHNLHGAYLHVMADAVTSVLAIVALVVARQVGWVWMDPAMGVVGSTIIARWSWDLLRDTGAVLLDSEVSRSRRESILTAIEADADNRVVDLHVWRVGPRHLAAIIALVSHAPRAPDHYKKLLGHQPDLAHLTVEVHACSGESCV